MNYILFFIAAAAVLSAAFLFWKGANQQKKLLEKQQILEQHQLEKEQLLEKQKLLERQLAEFSEANAGLKTAIEKVESAGKSKSSFFSSMAHEIRTPLNAIFGYMTLARSEPDIPEQITAFINKSELAAKHLLSIINNVLDISSIESGKMKFSHEQFDIRHVIRTLTVLFHGQAKDKGVKFDTIVQQLDNEALLGDELRINQVLMNLLSNAIKFTPVGGSVKLTVSQHTLSAEKVMMEFNVSDTGIGMAPGFEERLFKPFEQQNASISRNFGGSGLGLSITRSIVDLLNGSIKVESTLGAGSTFNVKIPFEIGDDSKLIPRDEHDFSQVYALVVDDEEQTCGYIKALLERIGVRCDFATNSEFAIQMIQDAIAKKDPYSICLMDWQMPGLDGIEATRQIRSLKDKPSTNLPIVIITAYDYSEINSKAKEAGATLVISKPLFQSTLFDLLVNVYGKYKIQESPLAPEVNYDFSGKRLLLVEDNEMNMEVAFRFLTKSGFVVEKAYNGKQALSIFLTASPGTFNAILMDVQMPDIDGHEVTRRIRASDHPHAQTIPIVAMTANAFASDILESKMAGMNDHVSKPINREKLFESLYRCMKKSPC